MTGSNRSYHLSAIAVCAIAVLFFGLLTSQTHAVTIASETFNNVTGFGNNNDIGNHWRASCYSLATQVSRMDQDD